MGECAPKGEEMTTRRKLRGHMNLGPCGCCAGLYRVRNLIMLPLRAPQPGTGWGCLVCDLPQDGALAAVCDPCLDAGAVVLYAIDGPAGSKERVAVARLGAEFRHDLRKHPEALPGDPG
jgi:hypothetical protein